MTATQKKWSGDQIQFQAGASYRKQRCNVVLTGSCQTHDFGIDQLLAREAGLAEKPPDSGLKPE